MKFVSHHLQYECRTLQHSTGTVSLCMFNFFWARLGCGHINALYKFTITYCSALPCHVESFIHWSICLPPTKVLNAFSRVNLSVSEQYFSKTRAWIWMKCCMSTGVWTWTNWLTFELDPDYSPDAGTGLLSPILYALQRRILLCWENPTCILVRPVAAARHGFKTVLFTASRGNTFVGGTCALRSAF